MRTEKRYCTNCRAPLPPAAAWCESCGSDAGEVFDGRMARTRPVRGALLGVVLLLVAAAAVALYLYRGRIPLPRVLRPKPQFDNGPIHVVGDRPGGARRAPGATLSEPEAVRALRRELTGRTERAVTSECLAVVGRGFQDAGYDFDAVDSCRGARLGRFHVDGKSGRVSP